PFWSELSDNFVQDAGRLSLLGDQLSTAVRQASVGVWAGALLAIAAIVALRLWGGRFVLRVVSTRVPAGRLRRSVFALLRVVLAVVAPGLIAMVLYQALGWDGPLPDTVEALMAHAVGLVWFGGYVAGLGNALLSPKRPSWRLAHMPDPVARGLRGFPLALALITVFGFLAERLYALVNASLATTVAVSCIQALALGLALVWVVMRGERLRRVAVEETGSAEGPPVRPLWLAALTALTWLVLVGSLACLVLGYVAFGSFAVRQVAWFVVVVLSAYLLSVLIDDLCMGWLAVQVAPDAPADAGKADKADKADKVGDLPTPWHLRNQFAVLLSGAARVFVALVALILIVAPFGEGPSELFQRTGELSAGLSIGEVQVRPDAVLQALLVLVLGLLGVRLLKGWLMDRLLPTTSMDEGMRTSATTLFGYAGSVTAVALAMSAVGIGLERIAWVASALSVGIGFGLQAVVQNFVSGLILLAERPVKVGDWVALGGVEGDIRRINVRATEIQMGDRSTVIVPNSEFITKTVRNVTHANPLGLVQIKLPMPLSTDAVRVRELVLAAFQAHEGVLDNPAPSVALDGIDNGRLVFNATGYVASPRLAYNVRSALLFEVLQQLRDAELPLSSPPTMLVSPEIAASLAPNLSPTLPAMAAAGPLPPP
ncbi:MAG: mechanosensitive ion channel protein, partial [Rhodoferax sp.]|nr:mechanosensitive ion channel protein [Rhodoferax sp.]